MLSPIGILYISLYQFKANALHSCLDINSVHVVIERGEQLFARKSNKFKTARICRLIWWAQTKRRNASRWENWQHGIKLSSLTNNLVLGYIFYLMGCICGKWMLVCIAFSEIFIRFCNNEEFFYKSFRLSVDPKNWTTSHYLPTFIN